MAHSRKRVLALLLALCFLAAGARVVRADGDQKININTANASELMTLHGIGEVTAKAIVAYREQNGPFKSVDDLVNVRGIGQKSLARFRDQITAGSAPGHTGKQAKAKPRS